MPEREYSQMEQDHMVLLSVIADLAREFGTEELGASVGIHMTCTEANLFAMTMAVGLGGDEGIRAAAQFLHGHAMGWSDSGDDLGDSHVWHIAADEQDPENENNVYTSAEDYVRRVLLGEDE